jgi:transposase
MAAVMIGVDPHKGSHTAVAIGAVWGCWVRRVRASGTQAQRLLAWAAAWPERIWAIEGAGCPTPVSSGRLRVVVP